MAQFKHSGKQEIMSNKNLTTHQLAKLLLEMEDMPVATNLGYESCFARDQAIDSSLVKIQALENGDDQPEYIDTEQWVLIGGDGFSED